MKKDKEKEYVVIDDNGNAFTAKPPHCIICRYFVFDDPDARFFVIENMLVVSQGHCWHDIDCNNLEGCEKFRLMHNAISPTIYAWQKIFDEGCILKKEDDK